MRNRSRQSVLFEESFTKPVHVAFDAEALSSEGGVSLLAKLDRDLRLTSTLLSGMRDERQQTKVAHSYLDLFRQRVYGIALGYSDTNDANGLASDPMMKLAVGRDPATGEDLAGQSTLSRFENRHTAREVATMGRELGRFVIRRLAKRNRKAKVITLDFDSTVDPTHGQQQQSLFNGFYDTYCYLPLLGFVTVDDQAEQHLCFARLRNGGVNCYRGVIPALRRIVSEIRARFRKARIRVRMDAGFYHPMVLEVLEELRVEYAIGMPRNAKLLKLADEWMRISRTLSEQNDETTTLFGEAQYRARSWTKDRRVVIKAEVLWCDGRPLKNNERFLITNRRRLLPENAYRWYCQRGDSENRIKELKNDLELDRTSCSRFVANQFRVLTTAAAYVLFQELRSRLRRTHLARRSVAKLRDMLLKIATRVVVSVRRIVCHFPTSMPWADEFRMAAKLCGASTR